MWLLSVLFALNAVEAAAQQENAGRLTRIAQILGGRRAREIRTASPAVQVQRGTGTAWINLAPRADLQTLDSLRVQRYVNAEVAVNRRTQNGVLTFLPELFYDQGRRVVSTVPTANPLREAVYQLRAHPQRPGELAVSIRRGALIVDWAHGQLEIDAAGTRSVIAGTDLVIAVDSLGNDGVLLLQSGAVTFPDFPAVQIQPGQLVRLQRGLPPTVSSLTAIGLQEYREAVQYNTRQVWSVPAWRSPPVLLAAAAAVVGATVAVVGGGSDGDGDRDGTVIVRIPE
jgi:hypothetical protein